MRLEAGHRGALPPLPLLLGPLGPLGAFGPVGPLMSSPGPVPGQYLVPGFPAYPGLGPGLGPVGYPAPLPPGDSSRMLFKGNSSRLELLIEKIQANKENHHVSEQDIKAVVLSST
ncbi:hypothetical protein ONE63_011007 [Megalurothrips usitatus]|uniref:Uncharacterized protein n=1 Tax=Megalurothrips usitatus TaxID=439358 RepID=A0AAV7XJD7_9NEOP|nr:hypothetical protein ONE63_011007 [Megalurothrips usitatus]